MWTDLEVIDRIGWLQSVKNASKTKPTLHANEWLLKTLKARTTWEFLFINTDRLQNSTGWMLIFFFIVKDYLDRVFSIRINTSRSVDMQMQPLLFTDEKSISPLSNNTNCSSRISIVCKWTQSVILQLLLGNSSIQILRDRSWWWTFTTSFPGHCAHKASWVPNFSRVTLFNGRDSVMVVYYKNI